MTLGKTLGNTLGRAALVLALVASAAPAAAQSEAQLAAARKAFKEGDEAEKARDLPRALIKFQEAVAVKETPQLILRIGGVQEKLGQLGHAMTSYERGLERAQAANLAPAVKVAREQMEALRGRVPTVVVKVARQYPDLVVTLDGQPLALGTRLYLDPGEHKIVANATGYDAKEKGFSATERDALEFQLDLAPTGAGVPPVAGPPGGDSGITAPASAPSKVPAAILIGGGGAALATGIVFFVVALSKDGKVDDLCGGAERLHCPVAQQDSINSDVSTVKTFQILGGVVGGVGVAAIGVGTYLLIRRQTPPPAATARFSVTPILGRTENGIAATYRF